MKLLAAFFRLIRWPNLVFIILTQALFYYCIILPSLPREYYSLPEPFTHTLFYFLVTASVLIAAGGYVINDYFDINIDQVNKPGKMVVEKLIKRRSAILLHLTLSFGGLLISAYVGLKTNLLVLLVNACCIALLWYYSTTFKKKLLYGNVIISLLTAWTVLVLYFAVNSNYTVTRSLVPGITNSMQHILKYAFLYAGFAFIISLVREVVKDIQDMDGDQKHGCRTMPIVWGIPASKVFTAVWLIVLIAALVIIQFYVLQFGWWWSTAYCVLFILLPLGWVLYALYKAQVNKDYANLSTVIKLIMLTGILSLLFFKLYA